MIAKALQLLGFVSAIHSEAPYIKNNSRPLVIGHRGSMGSFPEHTYPSYTAAYFEHADFIELDIQITKDGHFVMSHEPCLKELTDIEDHPEFEDRKGNYTIGFPFFFDFHDDYLIHDFTLAELKTLRSK